MESQSINKSEEESERKEKRGLWKGKGDPGSMAVRGLAIPRCLVCLVSLSQLEKYQNS